MPSADKDVRMGFPLCGIDVSAAFDRQPLRQTRAGTYSYTTPRGVNVRGYDAGQDRSRGGSRPGSVKYLTSRPGDQVWITQCLDVIVSLSATAQG